MLLCWAQTIQLKCFGFSIIVCHFPRDSQWTHRRPSEMTRGTKFWCFRTLKATGNSPAGLPQGQGRWNPGVCGYPCPEPAFGLFAAKSEKCWSNLALSGPTWELQGLTQVSSLFIIWRKFWLYVWMHIYAYPPLKFGRNKNIGEKKKGSIWKPEILILNNLY